MDPMKELADLNKRIQVSIEDFNRQMLMLGDPSKNSECLAQRAQASQDDVDREDKSWGDTELLGGVDKAVKALSVLILQLGEEPSENLAEVEKDVQYFAELIKRLTNPNISWEDTDLDKEIDHLEKAIKLVRRKVVVILSKSLAKVDKAIHDVLGVDKAVNDISEINKTVHDLLEVDKAVHEVLKAFKNRIGEYGDTDFIKELGKNLKFLRISDSEISDVRTNDSAISEWKPRFIIMTRLDADFIKELGKYLKVLRIRDSEISDLRIRDSEISEWKPRFNIILKQDVVELSGELPGLAKDQILVESSEPQTITIKGPTKCTAVKLTPGSLNSYQATVEDMTDNTKADDKVDICPIVGPILNERPSGEFCRNFDITVPIKVENTKTSLKDGILTITIPRLKPKMREAIRIAIN